jgi:Coenzyme PQQ synthesis protein D (PqqD)
MENSPIGPVARKSNLTVEALGSETVVYDHERHRVHCLNQSTSFIWQECDGRTQIEEIATHLPAMGLPADPDIVRSALKDLHRADLLVGEPTFLTSDLPSRRMLVQRLGLAAASAAALLPAITSIVAPTPAMAVSGNTYKPTKPKKGN